MNASALSASEPGAPLDDLDFARLIGRLGPFEHRPRLAVAVSGGPDSLALTLLAGRWASACGGSVVGVTVDHGLRPGSAGEARTVGRWLAARGIRQVVLTWTGEKPGRGIQAAARAARYRLLDRFCRRERILHLLLAHHRDDQAETVALRTARGSGPCGRAGMPAIAERRGFRLLRPLLEVPKERLVATLQAAGQAWLEDPSNHSPTFARGRLRTAGGPAPGIGGRPGLARRRTAADRTQASWLARHARVDPLGFVDFDLDAFRAAAPEVAADVLRRALLTVGGNPYPPRTSSLQELLRRLARGGIGTLAGVLVRALGRSLRFVCEARTLRGPPLPVDLELWFDQRFRIACRPPSPGLTVSVLGERGWLERRRLAEVHPARPVERAVGESLPALFREGVLVAVPQLGLAAPGAPSPDQVLVRFQPRHPLAGAPYAGVDG